MAGIQFSQDRPRKDSRWYNGFKNSVEKMLTDPDTLQGAQVIPNRDISGRVVEFATSYGMGLMRSKPESARVAFDEPKEGDQKVSMLFEMATAIAFTEEMRMYNKEEIDGYQELLDDSYRRSLETKKVAFMNFAHKGATVPTDVDGKQVVDVSGLLSTYFFSDDLTFAETGITNSNIAPGANDRVWSLSTQQNMNAQRRGWLDPNGQPMSCNGVEWVLGLDLTALAPSQLQATGLPGTDFHDKNTAQFENDGKPMTNYRIWAALDPQDVFMKCEQHPRIPSIAHFFEAGFRKKAHNYQRDDKLVEVVGVRTVEAVIGFWHFGWLSGRAAAA